MDTTTPPGEDAASRFARQTQARIALASSHGDVKLAASSLGWVPEDLRQLLPEGEIEEIAKGCMVQLEQRLHQNAAAGDTRAAEILLAAHYPEQYDPRVRLETWRQRALEAGAVLPSLSVHIISKGQDGV